MILNKKSLHFQVNKKIAQSKSIKQLKIETQGVLHLANEMLHLTEGLLLQIAVLQQVNSLFKILKYIQK